MTAKKLLTSLCLVFVSLAVAVSAATFTITIEKPAADGLSFSGSIPAVNASTGSASTNCTYAIVNGSGTQIGPSELTANVSVSHEVTGVDISSLSAGQYNISVFCMNSSDANDNDTVIRTFVVPVCPAGMSGSNTVPDPCLVTNCTQLQNMSLDLDGHFALNNNINCSDTVNWDSGQGFYPVGEDPYSGVAFTGTFDGQGYNITDLFISRTGTDYAALFGATTMSKIENVGLVDVNISCNRISSVVGIAEYTNITNCFATGHLEVVGTSAALSGGINGWIENGRIVNCHFIGTIKGNGKNYVGGITGNFVDSEIIDSYFIDKVENRDEIIDIYLGCNEKIVP